MRRWSTLVITRHTRECPKTRSCVRRRKHSSRRDGWRLTRNTQGRPMCASGGARREKYTQDAELYAWTPPLKVAERQRLPRVNVEEKLWHLSTCAGRSYALHREGEHSWNCRQRISRQVMNTCADCGNTACTAHVTPHTVEGEEFGNRAPRVNMSCQPCTGMTSRLVENDRLWNCSSSK